MLRASRASLSESESEQLFTGEDCYYFRCSALHQGSAYPSKSGYRRIWFFEPGSSVIGHLNRSSDGSGNVDLNIDINVFCNDIVGSAECWLGEVESTERYKTNYKKFMKRYPDGLLPFASGVPVIG